MNPRQLTDTILIRGGKSTTSGWITQTHLYDMASQAHRWAAGYKPWPFSEARVQTTYTSIEEWDFEGLKADSIRIMTIGGKRMKKLNFEDYLIFKEESPSSNERVFSDHGGVVFINTLADVSGTLVAYAQYMPAKFDTTDDATTSTNTTVFDEAAEEGDEAIVEEALSYIKSRDGNLNEANAHHEKAKIMLEELWKRIQDEAYAYQTHKDRGGIWERFDVLGGGYYDEELKRDQFN